MGSERAANEGPDAQFGGLETGSVDHREKSSGGGIPNG
jgi:hypothetical protein